ncbi:O-antigen ligase family protein [bacterium]|nr:O-antigen ligase family protein [bacterium]
MNKTIIALLAILFLLLAFSGGGWKAYPKAIGVVAICGLFMLHLSRSKTRLDFSRPYLAAWLLFLLWALYCTISSHSPDKSVEELILYCSYFMIFLLGLRINLDPHILKNFLRYFLLGSMAILLIGYYYFLLPRISSIDTTSDMIQYFFGTFYWKNPMGGYLIMILPLILSMIALEKKGWRVFFICLFALGGQALILTHSRGAWLSFLPAFLIWIALAAKFITRKALVYILLAIFLSLIITPLFSPPRNLFRKVQTISQISEDIEKQEQSFGDRITMYKGALRIIRDHPFRGVGLNAYSSVYPQYLRTSTYLSKYLHNQYLQITTEMGIPGLILFLFLLGSLIFTLIKRTLRTKDEIRILLGGSLAALLAVLFHILVDFDWTFCAITMPFWFISGLAINLGAPKEHFKPGKGILQRAFLIILAILTATLILTRYYAEHYYQTGVMLLNEGYYGEAELKFKRAHQLNPLSGEYCNALAQTYKTTNQPLDWLEYSSKAIKWEPYSADYHYELGSYYLNAGRSSEALKYFSRSVELAPLSRPQHYNQLAELFLERGNFQKALETYEKVAVKFSNDPNEWYNSSTIAHRYFVAEAYLQIARLKETMGVQDNIEYYRKIAKRLWEPREVDKIAEIFGHHIQAPEKVVYDFWNALSRLDSNLVVELVYENITFSPPDWKKASLYRILDINYDYIQGYCQLIFILELEDWEGNQWKEKRRINLELTEPGWRIRLL